MKTALLVLCCAALTACGATVIHQTPAQQWAGCRVYYVDVQTDLAIIRNAFSAGNLDSAEAAGYSLDSDAMDAAACPPAGSSALPYVTAMGHYRDAGNSLWTWNDPGDAAQQIAQGDKALAPVKTSLGGLHD